MNVVLKKTTVFLFCFLFCGELKGKPGCGSEELLHPVGLNVGTRHFLQCLGEKS